MLKEQHYRIAAEASINAIAVLDRYEGNTAREWKDLKQHEQEVVWRDAETLHNNLVSGKPIDYTSDFRTGLRISIMTDLLAYLDPELNVVIDPAKEAEGPRSAKFPDAPHIQLSGSVPEQEKAPVPAEQAPIHPVSNDPNDKLPVPTGPKLVGKTETPIK